MSDYRGLLYELREHGVDPHTHPEEAIDVMNAAADAVEHLEQENARLRERVEELTRRFDHAMQDYYDASEQAEQVKE